MCQTSEKHTETANSKKVYKKEEKQPASKTVKTAEKKKSAKDKRTAKEDALSATTTLDIISRAEDDIDQVMFSTQTIDMEEALRAFEEKYNKGGK